MDTESTITVVASLCEKKAPTSLPLFCRDYPWLAKHDGGDWGVLFFAYLIGRRVEIHVSVIYISMGKCVQKERYSGASKCHGTHFHILDCMSYELEHRSCAGRGNLDLQHGDSITRQRYLVNRP